MSSNTKASLQSRHQLMVQSYLDFIEDLREEGPEDETEGLSEDFLEHFKFIIKSKALDNYSPLAFYWVNLVDNLVFVLQMWQDADEEGLSDFWTEGEYASAFIQLQEEGQDVLSATQQLMPLLEGQVLGFFHWHLSAHFKAKENSTLYQLVPDLGDHDIGIRVGEKHQVTPPDSHPDSPSLPFWSKSFTENMVSIDDDGGELVGGMQLLETIQLGAKSITLKGATPELDRAIETHKERITKALELIKKYSPRCFDALEVFTESIVLVDEPGVVSYSLQSLPGYSNINVVERDFVDLIDDLVHENGHHALNAVLNAQELIEEDDDKIYWSPWRRALRPIRGMYHGYLTFCWAYALFSDLYRNKASELNESEKEKAQLRFVEEFLMLQFCDSQLDHAFKQGKVTKDGMNLVLEARKILKDEAAFVDSTIKNELTPQNAKAIEELRAHLHQANEQYLKSL